MVSPAASLIDSDAFLVAESDVKPIADASPWPTDAEEQFALAKKYLKGDGVSVDEKKAFDLMALAAAQNHVEAIGAMGFFYLNGIAVRQDEVTAFEWLKKAAALGSAKAFCNLGTALLTHKNPADFREGLEDLEKAAEQNLPEALFAEGEIYSAGMFGTHPDAEKAFSDYSQAAEAGHPEAANKLGGLYEKGSGVAIDSAKAEFWYRKAAEQHNPNAPANLGRLLSSNNDPAKRRESVFWLMVATENNDETAVTLLDEVSAKVSQKELAEACIKTANYLKK